ncbi:MAG: hypothetical protein HYU66_06070 [Armatimonadetes bacterium]|nr:hypothetical protein [Armatimonadota bacterium]
MSKRAWAVAVAVWGGLAMSGAEAERLFPVDLPTGEWHEFRAQGYDAPVTGVVYRAANPATNGMPVGGVDTGCLDLETSGWLGYCTLFNSHVPRRGPLGLPYLGLSVAGRTWVLCLPGKASDPGLRSLTHWALDPDLGEGQRLWAPGDRLPAWLRSVGHFPFAVPLGRVACHSPAVLRFVAPVAGEMHVAGGLWLARNLSRSQRWELRHNGVAVTGGALDWGPTPEAPLDLSTGSGGATALRQTAAAGDVWELVLTSVGTGDYIGLDFRVELAGRTYDVAADWSDEANPNGPWTYDAVSLPSAAAGLFGPASPLQAANEIHYWGPYPVADLEFETTAPVEVGLRAWSPFLPGDVVASMLPGAVFEVHLRNPGTVARTGTLAMTFPGPTPGEAGGALFERRALDGPGRGVEVRGELASYALAALDSPNARHGGGLGCRREAWANLGRSLLAEQPSDAGATVAVDFTLAPGESRVIPFVLAWHAPTWRGGGTNEATQTNLFTHMYTRHYSGAAEALSTLAARREELFRRVAAWQTVVYGETALPGWLRDSLINVLYMIAEDGLWARKAAPLPDWVREEDGLFGLNECPRGCPQIECIPCSFYGSLPLTYFYPELQLSTIRGYQGYQLPDGAPPWIFGGCTGNTPPIDFASPTRGYQFASNGISLSGIVDRFLLCRDTPDGRLARELYPMLKRSLEHTVALRTTPSYSIGEKIIAMPDGNQGTEWFEAPEPGWAGMTAHIGGLHLAELRIAERWARQTGDAEFQRQCETWLNAARDAMEQRLWDERGYYLNYLEPETGQRSDLVFGYQLDGEWVLAHHGLPTALPEARIETVLQTIRRCNVAVTRYGAVNYAHADGTVANPGGYGAYSYFPPELLMLAMTYMYRGQREFGLELARKAWENLICAKGYTWDMPNIIRGDQDTGERTFGNDYYQDMILWSLPAALAGEDVGGPCRPGGLVDRVLRAAAG